MIRFTTINAADTVGAGQLVTEARQTTYAEESRLMSEYKEALSLLSAGALSAAGDKLEAILSSRLLQSNEPTKADQRLHDDARLWLKYGALKNIALTRERQGRSEDALSHLIEAVQVDSSDVVVWHRLGKIALGTRDFVLARHAFECGLKLSSNNWPCIDKLAQLHFVTGDLASCATYALRLLCNNPHHKPALSYLAHIAASDPWLAERLNISRQVEAGALRNATVLSPPVPPATGTATQLPSESITLMADVTWASLARALVRFLKANASNPSLAMRLQRVVILDGQPPDATEYPKRRRPRDEGKAMAAALSAAQKRKRKNGLAALQEGFSLGERGEHYPAYLRGGQQSQVSEGFASTQADSVGDSHNDAHAPPPHIDTLDCTADEFLKRMTGDGQCRASPVELSWSLLAHLALHADANWGDNSVASAFLELADLIRPFIPLRASGSEALNIMRVHLCAAEIAWAHRRSSSSAAMADVDQPQRPGGARRRPGAAVASNPTSAVSTCTSKPDATAQTNLHLGVVSAVAAARGFEDADIGLCVRWQWLRGIVLQSTEETPSAATPLLRACGDLVGRIPNHPQAVVVANADTACKPWRIDAAAVEKALEHLDRRLMLDNIDKLEAARDHAAIVNALRPLIFRGEQESEWVAATGEERFRLLRVLGAALLECRDRVGALRCEIRLIVACLADLSAVTEDSTAAAVASAATDVPALAATAPGTGVSEGAKPGDILQESLVTCTRLMADDPRMLRGVATDELVSLWTACDVIVHRFSAVRLAGGAVPPEAVRPYADDVLALSLVVAYHIARHGEELASEEARDHDRSLGLLKDAYDFADAFSCLRSSNFIFLRTCYDAYAEALDDTEKRDEFIGICGELFISEEGKIPLDRETIFTLFNGGILPNGLPRGELQKYARAAYGVFPGPDDCLFGDTDGHKIRSEVLSKAADDASAEASHDGPPRSFAAAFDGLTRFLRTGEDAWLQNVVRFSYEIAAADSPDGSENVARVRTWLYECLSQLYDKPAQRWDAAQHGRDAARQRLLMYDICVNPTRVDSWKALGLSFARMRDDFLNAWPECRWTPLTLWDYHRMAALCFHQCQALGDHSPDILEAWARLLYVARARRSRVFSLRGDDAALCKVLSVERGGHDREGDSEGVRLVAYAMSLLEACVDGASAKYRVLSLLGKTKEKLGEPPSVWMPLYMASVRACDAEEYGKIDVYYRVLSSAAKYLDRGGGDIGPVESVLRELFPQRVTEVLGMDDRGLLLATDKSGDDADGAAANGEDSHSMTLSSAQLRAVIVRTLREPGAPGIVKRFYAAWFKSAYRLSKIAESAGDLDVATEESRRLLDAKKSSPSMMVWMLSFADMRKSSWYRPGSYHEYVLRHIDVYVRIRAKTDDLSSLVPLLQRAPKMCDRLDESEIDGLSCRLVSTISALIASEIMALFGTDVAAALSRGLTAPCPGHVWTPTHADAADGASGGHGTGDGDLEGAWADRVQEIAFGIVGLPDCPVRQCPTGGAALIEGAVVLLYRARSGKWEATSDADNGDLTAGDISTAQLFWKERAASMAPSRKSLRRRPAALKEAEKGTVDDQAIAENGLQQPGLTDNTVMAPLPSADDDQAAGHTERPVDGAMTVTDAPMADAAAMECDEGNGGEEAMSDDSMAEPWFVARDPFTF